MREDNTIDECINIKPLLGIIVLNPQLKGGNILHLKKFFTYAHFSRKPVS